MFAKTKQLRLQKNEMDVNDCNRELNIVGKQLKLLSKINTKKEFKFLAKKNNRQMKLYAKSLKDF